MAALKASPELFKRRISLFGPGVALFLLLLAFPHANLLAANIATSTPDDSSVFQLETDGAPSSFNGGSDGNYQTLGNGLSGTLRGVELAYGADTTYYAVNMAVMVDECSTALYDHCSTIASSPRLGGSWDGRREFDMPSYDLKPCKYYRIVISVNGSFGSLGQVFVYGSANDDYSYGAFTTHSPFDLFFIVHGASRIPPAPFCPAPVVIIPGVLGSWQKNGSWVIDPVFHTYDNLIDTLKANGYEVGKTLFTYPYDWRNSNADSVGPLRNEIGQIKSICQCSKVDIVAHSMGGLIASSYIESASYNNDIGKLVYLGTPHKGAPADYLTWEAGATIPDLFHQLLKIYLTFEGLWNHYLSLFDYIHDRPIASFQELLPIFDYLRPAPPAGSSTPLSLIPYPSGYPRNTFLENLDENMPLLFEQGIDVTNIIGDLGTSTASAIRTVPSQAGSALWKDGYPQDFDDIFGDHGLEMGPGDGTVPKASSELVMGTALPVLSVDNSAPLPATQTITFGNSWTTEDIAQSFTVGSAGSLNSLQVYIKRAGNPTGDISVRIMDDSGGAPGNAILANGAIHASSAGASFGWATVSFGVGTVLVPGKTYWFVLDTDSNVNGYYVVAANYTYASGNARIGKSGVAWHITSPEDLDAYFRVSIGTTKNIEISGADHMSLPTAAEGAVFKALSGTDAVTLVKKSLPARLFFQAVFSPANILVTLPSGIRIGADPKTGDEINEVPGAFYSGANDDKGRYIFIPNPPPGKYTVATVGTGGGSYTLASSIVTTASSTSATTSVSVQPGGVTLATLDVGPDDTVTLEPPIEGAGDATTTPDQATTTPPSVPDPVIPDPVASTTASTTPPAVPAPASAIASGSPSSHRVFSARSTSSGGGGGRGSSSPAIPVQATTSLSALKGLGDMLILIDTPPAKQATSGPRATLAASVKASSKLIAVRPLKKGVSRPTLGIPQTAAAYNGLGTLVQRMGSALKSAWRWLSGL